MYIFKNNIISIPRVSIVVSLFFFIEESVPLAMLIVMLCSKLYFYVSVSLWSVYSMYSSALLFFSCALASHNSLTVIFLSTLFRYAYLLNCFFCMKFGSYLHNYYTISYYLIPYKSSTFVNILIRPTLSLLLLIIHFLQVSVTDL